MVKMVLFSPGSVSSPYTNTGFSEKVKDFHVSPSLVLYLQEKDEGGCNGETQPGIPVLCCSPYLSWSVSVPCAMATRMPPWSPQV